MLRRFKNSYPQPAREFDSLPHVPDQHQNKDKTSTLILGSISLFSLAVVAGTMFLQSSGKDTFVQTAQVTTPQTQPEPVAVAPQRFSEPSPQSLVPTRQLPTEPVPKQLREVDVPRHIPQEEATEAPEPIPAAAPVQVTKPVLAQKPVSTQESAAAEISAAAPRLALVDEETGQVKDLGPMDMQLIAELLTEQVRDARVMSSEDAVTRLETAPLTAVASETTPPNAALNCVENLRALANQSTIYFLSGGAQLSPRAVAKIRDLGNAAKDCPNATIQVTGHSDPNGDEQANIAISWARADNTISALDSMGFDISRMDAVGFGARLPGAEGDAEPELDRRVEFRVMEKR